MCWLKLLLLLLLLLLKLNLAPLASKPPFPGNSYGYCARILRFSACTVQTTPRNLLAGIANNITSNTIQGRSDSFSNKLQRYLCSTEYSFKSFNPKKMGQVYSIMKSQSFDRCDSFGSLFLAPKHLYTYLVD